MLLLLLLANTAVHGYTEAFPRRLYCTAAAVVYPTAGGDKTEEEEELRKRPRNDVVTLWLLERRRLTDKSSRW